MAPVNERRTPRGRTHYDAVILAGGAARRLNGADKPALQLPDGSTLLGRVLAACADAERTVVVGPHRPLAEGIYQVRESPPGGGPAAALAAGLAESSAETVLLLAADLPFLSAATVELLVSSLSGTGADGVLLTDPDGREQPLTAAYRAAALRDSLTALDGPPDGLPLRAVLRPLTLRRLPDPDNSSYDCDTWPALAAARQALTPASASAPARQPGPSADLRRPSGNMGNVLDEWMAEAARALGVDLDVDAAGLLDMTRTVAHEVTRPAAPLTAFLVGYAAARAGGGAEAVDEASRIVTALAEQWRTREAEADAPSPPPPHPTATLPDQA
jgi:molybdopterin-guanine dinucleotide biosynthesis protein A